MTQPQPVRRYKFGIFEADATTGELRRQGVRVKLHSQPFQVLCLLLERRGELLTREEICRELWPADTFVDYEHGVNSAVNRIREALNDKASNPRFVETLARRGYRFIAPVERIGVAERIGIEGESAPAETLATSEVQSAEIVDDSFLGKILATPEDLPQSSHPVVKTCFLLLQAMYLGFYIGALANLAEIQDLISVMPYAAQLFTVMVVTAGLMIPVRAFLLCAVLFRAPGMRGKFLKLWFLLLIMDLIWSLSPFLLLHHMNYGLALACTALLVYVPFAQRSLILMGAGDQD